MKIVILNGSIPNYDQGLGKVISVMANVLAELGVELEEVKLAYSQIPYFDGMGVQATDSIMERLQSAKGVIFACTAQLFAPNAIMQTFLEFLNCPDYKNILRDKHSLLVVASKDGGERSALDYMAKVVSHLGGYESGRLGLQESLTKEIRGDSQRNPGSVQDVVEKITEDFFRTVRQNRKYIVASDYIKTPPTAIPAAVFNNPAPTPALTSAPALASSPIISQSQLNLNAFTQKQEQDIQELTAMFAQKFSGVAEAPPLQPTPVVAVENHPAQQDAPIKQAQTVEQQSQDLPSSYQPQISSGLSTVIQLSISGNETFDGYLNISDGQCTYTKGLAKNPEVTIISNSNTWKDVLDGKTSAQKAFMLGGLEVKGNFVILTKFDNLFKLQKV